MRRKPDIAALFPVIAGCGLIGTCLGIFVNTSGLFFMPIEQELSIGRGAVALTLTIYNLMHAFLGMHAPWFLERYGFRKMAMAGTALQVLSTVLISRCHSILPMYVLNALRGCGSGLIGLVTVSMMVSSWYEKNSALMTSIALSFSGIIGALLSPVISAVIAAHGWRTATVICAIIVLFLNLPAMIFPLSLNPESMPDRKGTASSGGSEEKKAKPARILFPLFLMVTVFSAVCSFAASLPPQFTGIADWKNLTSCGAMMVSVCMVSNTGGKILLGAMIDRFGVRTSVTDFLCLILTGTLLLLAGKSMPVLLAGAALYGLIFSCSTLAVSLFARELFDHDGYSRVFPRASFAGTVTNAAGAFIIGLLYDITSSYTAALLCMIVMFVIAFLMVHLAYHRTKPAE